jgi:hypothetical protein
MANVELFRWVSSAGIEPRDILYFWLGPNPKYGTGAITVTCHTVSGYENKYLEVIQMATRIGPYGNENYLDCVVRNNGYQKVVGFTAYASVITP